MNDFQLDGSEQYFDILSEISNIGAGNATTALAQMMQKKVDMSVPKVNLVDFKDLGDTIGGEEQIMAGVYLLVEGDVTGSMMFLLPAESAHILLAELMHTPKGEGLEFNEMELSALKEMGNIIVASYLNALSTLTQMSIYPSVPDVCIDMAGAILSVPAAQFGEVGDKILLIQNRFFDDMDMSGYFMLLPDVESYNKIFTALGM